MDIDEERMKKVGNESASGKREEREKASHILVIDDEEIIRNFLTDVLVEAGYEVTAVASAEAALGQV